jgi:hypothetical protein
MINATKAATATNPPIRFLDIEHSPSFRGRKCQV